MKKALFFAAAFTLLSAPVIAQQSSTGQSSGGPAVSRGGPGTGGGMMAAPGGGGDRMAMPSRGKKMMRHKRSSKKMMRTHRRMHRM